MKKALFFTALLIAGRLFSQQNADGVVISENELDTPDPSAILDIKAVDKGVLPGQFNTGQTNEDINDVKEALSSKVDPVTDGLIFYIPQGESDSPGFYYYDEATSNWFKLTTVLDTKIDIPDGSIIMYVGETDDLFEEETGLGIRGTNAEGWALCNGKSLNRPDLRGLFLMGADYGTLDNDVTDLGGTGGADVYNILEDNCEPHNHTLDVTDKEYSHTHTLNVIEDPAVIANSHRGNTDESEMPGRTAIKKQANNYTISADYGVDETEPLTPNGTDFDVEVDLDQDKWLKDYPDQSDQTPVDNRPKYIVVNYIIKMNINDDYNPLNTQTYLIHEK